MFVPKNELAQLIRYVPIQGTILSRENCLVTIIIADNCQVRYQFHIFVHESFEIKVQELGVLVVPLVFSVKDLLLDVALMLAGETVYTTQLTERLATLVRVVGVAFPQRDGTRTEWASRYNRTDSQHPYVVFMTIEAALSQKLSITVSTRNDISLISWTLLS